MRIIVDTRGVVPLKLGKIAGSNFSVTERVSDHDGRVSQRLLRGAEGGARDELASRCPGVF